MFIYSTVNKVYTCEVDFILVGVFGDRGPCEELGELAIELTSSSFIA